MPITLDTLKPAKGARKKARRVGRGDSSGRGGYSGRGQKGQRSRTGGKKGLKLKGFRGILLSIPKKRGFQSIYPKMQMVNLGQLQKQFKSADKITPETLKKKGLVDNIKKGVKILAGGELKKKLIIEGCKVSERARKKIKKVEGTIKESKVS